MRSNLKSDEINTYPYNIGVSVIPVEFKPTTNRKRLGEKSDKIFNFKFMESRADEVNPMKFLSYNYLTQCIADENRNFPILDGVRKACEIFTRAEKIKHTGDIQK
ncbi:hypothetical protein GJ496_001743 [Pomphorhynchus laevis]|nr:hypothetical protein GJ496_001743 [Pomphorhynchus laevis]